MQVALERLVSYLLEMKVETIKRKLRVTIEKVIEIEIMPSMFCGDTEEQYLKDFREGLWHVKSLDDVIKYAANIAAVHGRSNEDGLGNMEPVHMKDTTKANVYFDEISDDIECEFIDS